MRSGSTSQREAAKHPEYRDARTPDVDGSEYDAEYFGRYGNASEAYAWGSPAWQAFFDRIAGKLVDHLKPRSALDVGCAIGLLVGALRKRGVEAWGIDISQHALDNAAPHVRPFCVRASVTDGLRGRYDLITAIEVFEHVPVSDCERALDEITARADAILFSSSPTPEPDATHLNERPPADWLASFAQRGFVRDFDFDASIVAADAFLVRRGDASPAGLIAAYEADRRQLSADLARLRARTLRRRTGRLIRAFRRA